MTKKKHFKVNKVVRANMIYNFLSVLCLRQIMKNLDKKRVSSAKFALCIYFDVL